MDCDNQELEKICQQYPKIKKQVEDVIEILWKLQKNIYNYFFVILITYLSQSSILEDQNHMP